jgi:predicted ATP-grasp superfamily ATP-dependent carboligase
MRTLRKDPPGLGVARVATPWPDESLREGTVALLRRIGCRGIGYAEYKRDPRDGTVRLIGVDGRPFPTLGLARRAGVDLVRLAWEEVTGTPFGPAAHNGWRGHWIHLHADVLATLRFRRREALTLRDSVRPYLGTKVYAVWSLADPLPFAAQWSRTLRAALATLVAR